MNITQLLNLLFWGQYRGTQAPLKDGEVAAARLTRDGAWLVSGQDDAAVLRATTTAFAASKVVKTSAGALRCIEGTYKGTDDVYLMLFDATSLPANGTAPIAGQQYLLTKGPFTLAPFSPLAFETGLVVALSTTPDTLAIAGTHLNLTAYYE
jgi:hypothetical protein